MAAVPEIEAAVKRLESLIWAMLPSTAFLGPRCFSNTKGLVGWLIYDSDSNMIQVTGCPVQWIIEAGDDLPKFAQSLLDIAFDFESASPGE